MKCNLDIKVHESYFIAMFTIKGKNVLLCHLIGEQLCEYVEENFMQC